MSNYPMTPERRLNLIARETQLAAELEQADQMVLAYIEADCPANASAWRRTARDLQTKLDGIHEELEAPLN